ncbi:MAG: hypothetical protein WD044_13005 [Dongiaceae bacterium]
MHIRSVVFGSLVALLLTGCDDKQAAEIKAETEANLAALTASGDLTHGEVTVESEGDGYRVAIADTIVKPAPDMELHLGTLRYLHMPVDDDMIRYEDAEVDSPIALRQADGTDVGTMVVDIERASGTWYKPLMAFVSLDVLLPSVQMESPNEPTLQFDNVQATLETEDPRAERTNQTGTMSFDAMRVVEDSGERTALEGLRLESEFSGVNLAAWTTASNALDQAAQTGGDVSGAVIQMIDSITAARGSLVLDHIEHADAAGVEQFSLNGMQMTFGLADVDQEAGSLNLALGYDELTMAETAFDGDPTAGLMAPVSATINIAFNNVPFRQVASTLTAMAPNLTQTGEGQADIVALLVLSALQTALSNADTRIDLSGTQIALKDARMTLDGIVDVDPNAMFGAVAKLDLAIYDLDALTERAMALPAGPEAQQLQSSLMYLASVSTRSEDGGETVDRYKVVVTPTGDVQVNGQPVF